MGTNLSNLQFQPEGRDELKKRQLMELAILNGTYRDTSKPSPSSQQVAVTQSRKSTPQAFLLSDVLVILLSASWLLYACFVASIS
jgi:hypothetical protein